MTTPLTLWDWGRYKIDKKLEGTIYDKNDLWSFCLSSYKWDEDTLIINCQLRKRESHPTLKEMEILRDETFKAVRSRLGYYSGSHGSFDNLRASSKWEANSYPIDDFFSTQDYTPTTRPSTLGKSLEKSTKIVTYGAIDTNGALQCEGTLQGGPPLCRVITPEELRADIAKMFGN
jgi:hypothetical protein